MLPDIRHLFEHPNFKSHVHSPMDRQYKVKDFQKVRSLILSSEENLC